MRRNLPIGLRRVLYGALVPSVLFPGAGCATQRFVSDTHWSGPDTLYVAYNEVVGDSTTPRVKKCARAEGNTLQCVDEGAVNGALAH